MSTVQYFAFLLLWSSVASIRGSTTGNNEVQAFNDGSKIWLNDSANKTCLLLSFSKIEMEVGVRDKEVGAYGRFKESLDTKDSFNISKKDSHCGLESECLTLEAYGNQLTFCFNAQNFSYNLTSLKLVVFNVSRFPDSGLMLNNSFSAIIQKNMSLTVDTKTEHQSFSCDKSIKFKLNGDKMRGLITIYDLKFSAFRVDSSGLEWDANTDKCDVEESKAGNDIVPIAVGGGLTALLVLSLVGYLIIRHRSQ